VHRSQEDFINSTLNNNLPFEGYPISQSSNLIIFQDFDDLIFFREAGCVLFSSVNSQDETTYIISTEIDMENFNTQKQQITSAPTSCSLSSSEKIVHVNGVDICVETFGTLKNPAILLLAGGGSSMLFWEDDFCQRLVLGPRFVIRYDYRDTGRSTCYEPGTAIYSLRDFAKDALGLLDSFGLTKAHLVGFSLGGGISQLIAVEHADRVASMTLISSSPVGAYVGEPDLPSMSPEHGQKLAASMPYDWGLKNMVTHSLVEHYRLCASPSHPFDTAEMTAQASRIFDRSTSIQSMMNHGPIAFNRWERERLGEVTATTLVIHGSEDVVLPYPHGVMLSKEISSGHLLTLLEVGHELPRRVWDVVLPAILMHTSSNE